MCSDPEVDWYPQRLVCYKKMANEHANALYDQRYGDKFHDGTFPSDPAQWGPKRSSAHPFGHREGVTIWVAPMDLDPDGDWI